MKPLDVEFSEDAEKQLARIPRDLAGRVLKAVSRYAETGYGDIKRLQGTSGQYRLRVGDWRVLFAIDYSTLTMVVQDVLPRGTAYKD